MEECSKCGKPSFIVNRKRMLCDDCNYFRMHGMTRLDAFKHKESQKQYKLPVKKKTAVKTNVKRSETLLKDRETYRKVFSSKPNECEECGTQLPDVFEDEKGSIAYVVQYSHILGKAAYPEFRHDPRNFNRLCFNCHRKYEDGDSRETMKIFANNQVIIQTLFNERNERSSQSSL